MPNHGTHARSTFLAQNNMSPCPPAWADCLMHNAHGTHARKKRFLAKNTGHHVLRRRLFSAYDTRANEQQRLQLRQEPARDATLHIVTANCTKSETRSRSILSMRVTPLNPNRLQYIAKKKVHATTVRESVCALFSGLP